MGDAATLSCNTHVRDDRCYHQQHRHLSAAQALRDLAVEGRHPVAHVDDEQDQLGHAEGGAEATMTGWDGGVAAGEAVMSEGKNFVQFTVLKGEYIYLGAMSAAWDVEGARRITRPLGRVR